MSILSDDNSSSGLNEAEAEAALMESFDKSNDDQNDEHEDAEELSADSGDEGDASEDEEIEDEEGGEGEDADEADEPDGDAASGSIGDDHVVQVSVNGETRDFTIGSLKRLAGQEAALTRKSQEADLVGGRAAAALQAAIDVAGEDFEPYKDVDWLVLQQEVDPETFKWHRENAARAQGRLQKLLKSAEGFETSMKDRRDSASREAAQAAVTELQSDIQGWNDQLYGEILDFGEKQGLDADDLKGITNAKVIKLLHKAMLYDKGQKLVTKKVTAPVAKVLKGTTRTEQGTAQAIKAKKAEKRLAQSGSDADAIATLMGRWR